MNYLFKTVNNPPLRHSVPEYGYTKSLAFGEIFKIENRENPSESPVMFNGQLLHAGIAGDLEESE